MKDKLTMNKFMDIFVATALTRASKGFVLGLFFPITIVYYAYVRDPNKAKVVRKNTAPLYFLESSILKY